jgi:anti-sigma regulatory factor (Ser/Thr protein kinase)
MNETGYSSKLVLPNNLHSLLASQVFTDELAKKAQLDSFERAKICLGLEEAILNVITHSYGTEEKAMYEIIFRITDSLFSIVVRDEGKPIDGGAAFYPGEMTARDIDSYPESGLGFRIMRSSFDQVMVRNHPGGKELHLIKYLPITEEQTNMAGIAQE